MAAGRRVTVSAPAATVTHGSLLLIDDETRLRQLTACVLELEGYTIMQIATAAEGLTRLRDHAAELEVGLTTLCRKVQEYGLEG